MNIDKLIYLAAGSAILALASCSQDDIQAPAAGDGNVNLTLTVPANALGTRAFADGLTANDLEVAVFDKATGNLVISKEQKFAETGGALQTTVSLSLANGKSYQIAFFAHKKDGSAYTFDTTDKKVKVDYSKMNTSYNTDAFDCFYKLYETGTVTGPINETITLTRPVAQVNWGTSDLEEPVVTAADAYGAGAANLVTKITTKAYTEFDMLTSDVVTTSETDVVLPYLARPAATETFPYEPATYDYVSMQYLLVPAASSVVDLTLEASNSAAATQAITTVTVANAPVQANYRTNIFGALLTNSAEFKVVKEPNFKEPDNNVEVKKLSTAEAVAAAIAEGGNFELVAPLDLIDLTASTPAKPLVLTLSAPVKQIKLGTSEENPQPTTIAVAKDVAYPEFLFPGSKTNNAIRNLTITGDLTSSERCPGFDAQGTQTNPGVKTIEGLTFENVPFTGAGVNVAFTANPQTTRDIVVRNCDFADLKKPAFNLQSNHYAGDNIGNIVIENNTIAFAADPVKTSNGIYVLNTTGGTVSIKNNTLSGGPYHGLMLGNNKADITAEDNKISGFAEDGIKMDQPAAKINILNNSVQAKQYGIRIARFVAENNPTITITGNTVDMTICQLATSFNGIYLGYSSAKDSPATIFVKDNIKVGECDTWFKITSSIVPSADSDYATPFAE